MAVGVPCGVPQSWLPTRVITSPAARRLVRERGGTLFVVAAEPGPRASTAPPGEVMDVDGLDGGGYLLVLDRRLGRPAEIHVDVVDGEPAVTGTGPAPTV